MIFNKGHPVSVTDALNRLTSVTGSNPNQDPKTMQYDALGNITYKSDVGSYTYAAVRNDGSNSGTNRPHPVSQVAGASKSIGSDSIDFQ